MAIAGRWMGCYFNKPNFDLINYNVYALSGDGCMADYKTEHPILAKHAGLMQRRELPEDWNAANLAPSTKTRLTFN